MVGMSIHYGGITPTTDWCLSDRDPCFDPGRQSEVVRTSQCGRGRQTKSKQGWSKTKKPRATNTPCGRGDHDPLLTERVLYSLLMPQLWDTNDIGDLCVFVYNLHKQPLVYQKDADARQNQPVSARQETINRPHHLVVRTSPCGRDNLGSILGVVNLTCAQYTSIGNAKAGRHYDLLFEQV